MVINSNILKKIKQVMFTATEPPGTDILWAKPAEDGLFAFYIFYNNKWERIESSSTVVIPSVSAYMSAFINDVGYISGDNLKNEKDIVGTKQIVDGSILKEDLSDEVKEGLHESVATNEDIKNLFL